MFDLYSVVVAILITIILVHVVPWMIDPRGIKGYPGPFLAKFSDLWYGYVAKMGYKSEVVYKLHQRYGPIIRIAPNHISIANPEALATVYGHGTGTLKSDFYDAFAAVHRRTIFSTRDRAEHTRKRKIVAQVFSQKSLLEFEPYLKRHVKNLIRRWDAFYEQSIKGMSGNESEGGWYGKNGRLYLDALPWANYLALDIIGDLAYGGPFGMIDAGKDIALAPKNYSTAGQKEVMDSYGKEKIETEVEYIPAIEIMNGRGDHAMCMGVLPPHWRPIVKYFPGYRTGATQQMQMGGIAIMAVAKRLAHPTDRQDLLNKLQSARDPDGNPMPRAELTAEAHTLLIAGSDTISNSMAAIFYHLAAYPNAQEKLQKELDDQLGTEDELVANAEQIKRLPYLDACINETLRIQSASAQGLPRVVPKGGLTVVGQFFPEGTVLSVPTYTIHRDINVWGEDVEVFRPERWFERDANVLQKTFNAFSLGPRACVGRNLAILELQIVISSLFRRYSFALEHANQVHDTKEGFIRKSLGCRVGIKHRD